MNDPWQPSPEDIREWARNTRDPWLEQPCADWPLALAWTRHENALLELAADESCPSRKFMLFILYFVVGHALHDGFDSVPQPVIEGFVRRADNYENTDLKTWQDRCWKVLRNPATFQYQQWCGGDYAEIADWRYGGPVLLPAFVVQKGTTRSFGTTSVVAHLC
ncbi:MAG: hypothetical protein AAF456_14610 [Planctomycetota bacterium]